MPFTVHCHDYDSLHSTASAVDVAELRNDGQLQQGHLSKNFPGSWNELKTLGVGHAIRIDTPASAEAALLQEP
jgi:hypothetical protein